MEMTNRLTARCQDTNIIFSIKKGTYEIECQNKDGSWELHPTSKVVNYYKSLIEDFGLEIQFEYETSGLMDTSNPEYYSVTSMSLLTMFAVIIFKYDNVVITNKWEHSTKLGTMYITLRLGTNTGTPMISGFRTEVQYSHVLANYHHSHTKTSAFGSYTYGGNLFCTGSYTGMGNLLTQWRDLIQIFNRRDGLGETIRTRLESQFLDWAEAIRGMILPMIRTESIDGGPYIQMCNISTSRDIYEKSYCDSGLARNIANLITHHKELLSELKFTCDNFGSVKITNVKVLIQYLLKWEYTKFLFADIGNGYIKYKSDNSISDYSKRSAENIVAHRLTPFKWNGERLKITLIDDTEIKTYEPVIPARIVTDIEVCISSDIRALQKHKWMSDNMPKITSFPEANNIEQITEYDTPIAYPTS